MKIERKKRPTQFECGVYNKEYYDRCIEINTKHKQFIEEHPSLDGSSVSLIKESITLNDDTIKKCEDVFKSSHRTRRPEYMKLKRLREKQ